MDSHQLLEALHEANRQAGRRPVKIVIEATPKKPQGHLAVTFKAAPDGIGGTQQAPCILITYKP